SIKRIQGLQERGSLCPSRSRRRIKETQGFRVANAPRREGERKAGKVCGKNFRSVKTFQRCRLPLVPQANGNTGTGAASATPTLVGARPRNAAGLQRSEPRARLIYGNPAEARIQNDPNALNGERRFSNGGRQHDLAAARLGW